MPAADPWRPALLAAELVGIGLIGDGLVTLLLPRRHLRRWQAGPGPWRRLWEATERRQPLRLAIVGAKLALGAWIVLSLPAHRTGNPPAER